jgi:DNA-binding SARP family transcriptional activator
LLPQLLQRTAPSTRRQLARLFWPASSEAQVQTNLRQLLYVLRQRLPNTE